MFWKSKSSIPYIDEFTVFINVSIDIFKHCSKSIPEKATNDVSTTKEIINIIIERKYLLISFISKFVFENITNTYQSNEVDAQERKIIAPITGSIAKILVKNGQVVSKDEAVVFIEAMKMEYKLVALKSGKVLGLKNKKGDLIEKGETLLEIE